MEKWQLTDKLAPPQETQGSVLNLGLYREISLREGRCYGDGRPAPSEACSHAPLSYAGPRRAQESQAMMCNGLCKTQENWAGGLSTGLAKAA